MLGMFDRRREGFRCGGDLDSERLVRDEVEEGEADKVRGSREGVAMFERSLNQRRRN